MAFISMDHVSKIYPDAVRPALDDINLHIDRGDFVFLVGASGSGKTTLLRLLLCEEQATGGEIRVGGNDLRRISNRQIPRYRRSLGMVFQDYKLLNNKTVWENVAFALEVLGSSRTTIKTLVPKVLETVGLTGKEKDYPQQLSGGEQQRVTLARAYVNHPQILLADEPTGNLDPTTSLGIMEVIEAINRTGTTVVMATHNEEIVNSMRKRVVELHNGKLVRDQQNGYYDSAAYFPDREVAEKSRDAIGDTGKAPRQQITAVGMPAPTGPTKNDLHASGSMITTIEEALSDSDHADAGIARLAQSVHSGKTGRYGEAFAPVETTLTWGKGMILEETEDSEELADAVKAADKAEHAHADAEENQVDEDSVQAENSVESADVHNSTESEEETTEVDSGTDNSGAGRPPAPPAPPAPPETRKSEPEEASSTVVPAVEENEQAVVPGPPAPPAPPQAKKSSDESSKEEEQ